MPSGLAFSSVAAKIVGNAVVGAGADERQSESHVGRLFRERLGGDQSLVVIERVENIEAALAGESVWRERAGNIETSLHRSVGAHQFFD